MLRTEVSRIRVERGRVVGVETRDGRVLTAARYVSNVDPQRTAAMIGAAHLPRAYRERLHYPYSSGNFTLYLGVRDLDLRDHGFGSWNVWHYPHDDLNAIYRRQLVDNDYREPWLFMSTPTLHTDEPGLCPPGHQILELATSASYAYWRQVRDTDRRRYNLEKKRVRDRIVQIIEERYVPRLSKHPGSRVMGTPATNERFCGAPHGNAYGAALTPRHVGRGRLSSETPLANLWLVDLRTGRLLFSRGSPPSSMNGQPPTRQRRGSTGPLASASVCPCPNGPFMSPSSAGTDGWFPMRCFR